MSITFRITTAWLEHSTKFYQLFRIERFDDDRFNGRAAAVGHYGSKNLLQRGGLRPIQGGQCAVYLGVAYETKLSEKKRKGYVMENAPLVEMIASDEDFRTWLRTQMPTKHREEILQTLGLSLDPNAQPIDPDDEPTPEPETVTRAPEETPEGWGDW
ncbi:hypothetical protein GFK26_18655 [Variovorax paradoxus]|uniref:Uncharacterized protein n=1 Tax=Variovorax paradoxus TaxID=34073 RepID=A0A5Q0M586_VARPD|nr:hypothetical protein [Variovorax paradoxus]QFZ84649.1 hypothetical protein GFK26_18655 [Variovorax paradoxus]